MKSQHRILVIGAGGQIGTELVHKLRKVHGVDQVLATDINDTNEDLINSGPFRILNVLNKEDLYKCLKEENIDTVYLLAAFLSANAEKHPLKAWNLNMDSLLHILELAKEGVIQKTFWPSSIAVFGPTTPKLNTPQNTICNPTTVYGISKLAGENWCAYYRKKYNVDVRSIRYPGIISHKTKPGGGTTDYAVEIFYKAIENGNYTCYLKNSTALPMMYIEDAVQATIQLMEGSYPSQNYKSYNIHSVSFTPQEIAETIKHFIPSFEIHYKPDFRQEIADTWPTSLEDKEAKKDWDWQPKYDLEKIAKEMICAISNGLTII